MKPYGYVYLTTNRLTGGRYVGQKKGSFDPFYLGSGKRLIAAVGKYGRDSFAVAMLQYAGSREELDDLERLYIREDRELYPRSALYNIADGGIPTRIDGMPFMSGRRHSAESKAKMSASRTGPRNWLFGNGHLILGDKNPAFGKHHSEESRRRTGEGNKKHRGAEHGNFGKVRTPEMRAKVSAANKGKPGWNKGRKATPEARAAISAARKALFASGYKQPYTEETRHKISEGRKRYWAEKKRGDELCA